MARDVTPPLRSVDADDLARQRSRLIARRDALQRAIKSDEDHIAALRRGLLSVEESILEIEDEQRRRET